MKHPIGMDRRSFVQMVGTTALWRAVGSRFGSSESPGAPTRTAGVAYVGGEHGIHVYSIAADERFIIQQTMTCAHPVAMSINGGNLYVANGISEYGSLPRGSVEAYAIDGATGRLEFKNRAPLSLSRNCRWAP
jgi:6-phosphogluconolactonase (cycloisomerase 2 family)